MSNPCEKLSEVEGTLRPPREEKDRVKLLPATQEIAPARRQQLSSPRFQCRQVTSLSPNRRLMIAMLSPDGFVEMGPRDGPPEKTAP
jgi:hypothetical protein